MADFSPVSAAIGGALIGLAATLLMLLTGRIAGISSIFAGCLVFTIDGRCWRIAFIAGLRLAPLTAALLGYPMPSPPMPASWSLIVVAGLLVGFGTRLSGGCTSGHGVCGIAGLLATTPVTLKFFSAVASRKLNSTTCRARPGSTPR